MNFIYKNTESSVIQAFLPWTPPNLCGPKKFSHSAAIVLQCHSNRWTMPSWPSAYEGFHWSAFMDWFYFRYSKYEFWEKCLRYYWAKNFGIYFHIKFIDSEDKSLIWLFSVFSIFSDNWFQINLFWLEFI